MINKYPFKHHCNTVKNKLQCSGTPNIFLCIPPQEVYIDQCTPVDNSKINFTIVRRFTLINVHLLTIYKKEFYYCHEVYIGQCKNIYFLQYHNGNGRGLARRHWKIPTLSFEVANASPCPSASSPDIGGALATSQDAVGIFQYLLARPLPMSQSPSFFLCKCILCHFDILL